MISYDEFSAQGGSALGGKKSTITLSNFLILDIRIGTITLAERIQGSNKLLRLEVDLGNEARQIVAGIAQFYEPEKLIGRQIPILANLEPRMLRGVESQGMLLAADGNGEPVLFSPDKVVAPGSVVK